MCMWQKCPICDGTGKTYNLSSLSFKICSVCNGAKIISELTGLPPNYEKNTIKRQKYMQKLIPEKFEKSYDDFINIKDIK